MKLMTLNRFLFGTLRGRLIIGVAAVHAALMTLFVYDLTLRQHAMLLDRQVEQAVAMSQALATTAAGWIAADDLAGLEELVEIQRHYPEIRFAILTDKEGRVLAATDKSKNGLYVLDLPREIHLSVLSRAVELVDVVTPALIAGRHVGWARVGISQRVAGEKLAEITRNGIIYSMVAITIGSFIAWMMGRRITRRLYTVQETINRVRAGDSLARSSLTGNDEAAMIAHEFNSMLDTVAERTVELSSVNEQLQHQLGERKQMEAVLRERTAELDRYFTKALDLLCIADTNGYFRRLNPQWESTLGFRVSELEGHRFLDFVHPDDLEATLKAVSQLAGQKEVLGFTNRYRCKDGSYRWIEWKSYPSGGYIYAVARDITERKQAEMLLRHSEERFRRLAENAQDVIFRISLPEGTVEYMSPAAKELFGYAPGEFYVSPNLLREVIHPDWLSYFMEQQPKIILGDMPPIYEFQIIHKSGEVKWVNQRNILVHEEDSGQVVAVEGIVTDITERKKLEEDLRRWNAELEQRVTTRTAELQDKNQELEQTIRLFVGRELRMVELKERLKKLEEELLRKETPLT